MQENNGITVDYAFIAQRAEVNIHGLLSLEGGGISRLVVGSLGKELSLAFVARVRAETADSPLLYTCQITTTPPAPSVDGTGVSYGDVRAYIFTREGGFLVFPVTMQVFIPGEHRLRLHAYPGIATSDEHGVFDSSEWPVISDMPLFIQ